MLHNHIFVLDVIVLKSVGVVKVNQKDFRQKVLNDLPITFYWKYLLLALSFNFN
jgi:hypothetical protein